MTTRKSIPKSETVWETIHESKYDLLITSDKSRLKYSMWKHIGKEYQLLGTAASPPKLKQKFKKELTI